MENQKFTINLSAEEVDEHTIMEGVPPALAFVKGDKHPEKKPYTKLFCQKVAEVTPAHSAFAVDTPLKYFTGQNDSTTGRCYVKCKHNVTKSGSSVVFKKEDLKAGNGLELAVEIKCPKCLIPILNPVPASAQPSTSATAALVSNAPSDQNDATTSSGSELPPMVLGLRNPLTPRFEKVMSGMSKYLSRVYHFVSAVPNPEAYFDAHREEYADKIRQLFMAQTDPDQGPPRTDSTLGTVQPQRSTENQAATAQQSTPAYPPAPPPSPPPPPVRSDAVSTFMTQSIQAQKRKHEADEAKKKLAEDAKKKKPLENNKKPEDN